MTRMQVQGKYICTKRAHVGILWCETTLPLERFEIADRLWRVPSHVDALSEVLTLIDDTLAAGSSVLVHCRAGAHRAGTLTVSFMVWKLGHDPRAAHALVKAKRRCWWCHHEVILFTYFEFEVHENPCLLQGRSSSLGWFSEYAPFQRWHMCVAFMETRIVVCRVFFECLTFRLWRYFPARYSQKKPTWQISLVSFRSICIAVIWVLCCWVLDT